MKTVAKGLTE